MKCILCKQGETTPGHVTVTLQRGETVVVIRGVPAEVCENCGEYYLSQEVTARVQATGEDAVRKHAEVEIVRYAA